MKLVIAAAIAGLLSLPAGSVLAAQPADPDCLGQDAKVLVQAAHPWGQNIVRGFAADGGGFNDELLGHLQGVPTVSSCPDGGFPSHVP